MEKVVGNKSDPVCNYLPVSVYIVYICKRHFWKLELQYYFAKKVFFFFNEDAIRIVQSRTASRPVSHINIL